MSFLARGIVVDLTSFVVYKMHLAPFNPTILLVEVVTLQRKLAITLEATAADHA